jgi:hypothetical protein
MKTETVRTKLKLKKIDVSETVKSTGGWCGMVGDSRYCCFSSNDYICAWTR